MRSSSAACLALGGVAALLAGCAGQSPVAPEAPQSCRAEVRVRPEHPAVTLSAIAGPGGGAVGIGAGAMAGLQVGGPLAIFTAPIGAAIGATYGIACSAAIAARPTLVEDVGRIAAQVPSEALARTLRKELGAPRTACRYSGLREEVAFAGAIIVEVEAIDVELDCLSDRQHYAVIARWSASQPGASGRFEGGSTRCLVVSAGDVDAWLRAPGDAGSEFAEALARTGRRIGQELIDEERRGTCSFRFEGTGGGER